MIPIDFNFYSNCGCEEICRVIEHKTFNGNTTLKNACKRTFNDFIKKIHESYIHYICVDKDIFNDIHINEGYKRIKEIGIQSPPYIVELRYDHYKISKLIITNKDEQCVVLIQDNKTLNDLHKMIKIHGFGLKRNVTLKKNNIVINDFTQQLKLLDLNGGNIHHLFIEAIVKKN